MFWWFFVFFLIFLLRNFIHLSICTCFKIFMQFKMLRQSAVNFASTRKLRFVPLSLPSSVLQKRFTYVSYLPHAFWQTVVKSEFVLLFVHRISITYNCLSTLLFMNSVTKKNEIKKIKIEKQKTKKYQNKYDTLHLSIEQELIANNI